jgi:hypothetical protein
MFAGELAQSLDDRDQPLASADKIVNHPKQEPDTEEKKQVTAKSTTAGGQDGKRQDGNGPANLRIS